MAMATKFLIASLLLSLLVLHFAEAGHDLVNSNLAASSPPKKIVIIPDLSHELTQNLDYRLSLIVEALARQGASYHRGHACAREHVGLVVQDAAVFLQEQPVTMRLAPATPA
ncbi:hypothetical protein NC653_005214 [Populus alba x Populus x berolinensis]|uniref:Uncharacterized protein n=1 Tax=Populus alba x Populus x berolinensis TaxID=444605 RepID=A0AAD6RCE3_9ROSI|nr:hypothetical protein NC653_005214 [Populus alba x Populus x berolinensis]